MPDYEIYALKYAGPLVRTGAHLMWYQDWDKIEKIYYYFWHQGGGRNRDRRCRCHAATGQGKRA